MYEYWGHNTFRLMLRSLYLKLRDLTLGNTNMTPRENSLSKSLISRSKYMKYVSIYNVIFALIDKKGCFC